RPKTAPGASAVNALLPAETALQRILENLPPPGEDVVPVAEAPGRVLARDLAATLTQPPFDSSAMDGYAIHGIASADTGARWTVVGESAAGSAFDGHLDHAQAIRIFTGAPVPAECGTVVIQENVTRDGNAI